MSILIGGENLKEMFIGTKKVMRIYRGTELVYDNETGNWVLYDNGAVEGIAWAENKFNRLNYTAYATAKIYDERMLIQIAQNANTASYYYNAHVATVNPIKVPASATRLNLISNGNSANWIVDLRFGLLPSNISNSYDDTKGGQISSTISAQGAALKTHSLILNDDVKGRNDLHIVINGRQRCDQTRHMYIYKVWFD